MTPLSYLCAVPMPAKIFDPNGPGSSRNNIFGLPFSRQEAALILLPVPWEVTVSYRSGTARAPEHIFEASRQIDLPEREEGVGWKQGIFMPHPDRQLLIQSDFLRKQAELCINFLNEGGRIEENRYLKESVKQINEGCWKMNQWVEDQVDTILGEGKKVGLVGGDHSTTLGLLRALGKIHGSFGILQVDAHCDLRKSYLGFHYSHASVMANALEAIPSLERLVQVGSRDFCEEEINRIREAQGKVVSFGDDRIRERLYEGESWKTICGEIADQLPAKVHLSLDIDGMDPKLCPHTGTPVPGGLEDGQLFYLLDLLAKKGKQLISFDLVEVSYAHDDWDVIVGARILFRLSELLLTSRAQPT